MGKVIKFPLRTLEIETENEAETGAAMVKAIRDAYSEAEIEAIRLELEGLDEADTEILN